MKIYDEDDCMEEIQNIQKQLKDLSEGTGAAAVQLTRRIANIESTATQVNETLQNILSSQLYLVKKLKRNRVVPKSMGDSDIFENDDPWDEVTSSSVDATTPLHRSVSNGFQNDEPWLKPRAHHGVHM